MWLRTLLLIIVVLLVVRAVTRLVRGIAIGASSGARPGTRPAAPPAPPAVKMIADPVCGTFVVPGKALTLARGGETFYFCSERCRTQWTSR